MRTETLRRMTAAAAALLTITSLWAQPGQPGRRRAPAQEAAAAPTLPQEWVDQFQWRSVGPANMSGRITALAVYEADPSTYWVASASGGLLKTTNNGITFEHQFDREKTVSIGDVAVAQSDPSVVWVGTGESNPRNSVSWGNGVYKSTDGGRTWAHKGLDESFQIGRIVIHPENPDIVYVGALGRLWGPNEQRGLYKTTDGGETWQRILYIDDKTGVVDVNMHPEDPDTLLIATYERQRDEFCTNDPAKKWGPGSGIFRTTDGGATWTQCFAGLPSTDLGRIDIDYYRADPNVVYALVESSRIGEEPENAPYAGIQGEDAEVGARLTEVVADGPAARAGLRVGDIVVKLGDEVVVSYDDLIAKIRGRVAGDTVGVEVVRNREVVKADWSFAYRPGSREDTEAAESAAAGESEEAEAGEEAERNVPAPFRTRLGGQIPNVHRQQGPDGHEFGGVYKSTDGGGSWVRINSLNPRPMYFSQIRVDPSDDRHIFVLGISLHYSGDGGETFNSDAHQGGNGATHVDHHAMWINPEDGRHVILGNDGGLYVTHDRAAHWDHLNSFAIGQFYHVAVGPQRNYRIFGGLQDNGSWGGPSRSGDGAGPINEDWFRVGGGDGFICAVDPEDPDEIYYESQNGAMGRWNLRTGDRGFMRVRAPRGMSYRFNWRTPFMLSNHNSQIWYSAGNYVFKSLRKGTDIQRISPEITNTDRGSATALTESPRDAGVLYVGTDDGALWMTRDGGREWVNLFDLAQTDDEPAADAAGEDDAPAQAEPAAAAPDDPITGRWTLEMAGGRPGGRPGAEGARAGGFGLTLDLKRADDNSITGTFSSRMGDGELSEGSYDPETGAVKLVYDVREMAIELNGTLAEGVITGTMALGERMSRDFTARRGQQTTQPQRRAGAEEPEAGPGKPIAELVATPLHVSGLEASRFETGRVYLALDGHRSDDDAPYIFVSEDYGRNWQSLSGSLPADAGSVRTVREDITSPDILYIGTEFGAWVSVDRGQTWRSLNTNLPTVAVHEIAQHRSSGEIIAGTHGRSIWILDVTPLRQMNAEALSARTHLFQPNTAIYWRSEPGRGGTLRRFEGQNDRSQADIYYRLSEDADVSLEVRDHTGKAIRQLEAPGGAGLHRVSWDLRREAQRAGGRGFRGRFGPRVEPGNYLIVLNVNDQTLMQTLRIEGDPDHPQEILWGTEYDRRLEAEREQMGGEEEDAAEPEFSIIW
ncbi:MAG: PDZ domain-containing protein [Phycisphaerales bacterium JB039]